MRTNITTSVNRRTGMNSGYKNFLRRILSYFLLSIFFIQSYAQLAPVQPPKGGFKIDGILRANVTTPGGDWIPRLNAQGFTGGLDSFVLNSAGVPKDAATTGLARDLFNSNSDSIFANGSKFNDSIGSLRWGTSGPPSKNDINNALFHVAANPAVSGAGAGDQWAFIAGDRLSTSGTSYIDFEFLQNTLVMNSNGTFTGGGPAGGRTLGDINVSMEYTNGGSKPIVVIYRWAGNAASGYFWDSTGSAQYSINGSAFAETNRLGPVDVPFNAFGNPTYDQFAFVEAAINVTRLLSSGGNCQGLSVKTLWIKTKASASSTAALKDFMKPISVSFNFGSVSLTNPGNFCVNASPVTLQGTPAGGTFSGPGVSGNQFSPSVAGAGTWKLYYEVPLGISCTKKDSVTVKVFALPTASISGATSVCKDATSPFVVIQGSGGIKPYTFSYNVNGGGTLQKTTTGTFDTVKIAVPTGTATTLTYNLTGVSDSACTNTASGSAAVVINPLPTASAGTAPAAQCFNVNGNTFNLSGSGSNGNPSWAVQTNANSFGVQINSGNTFTPSVVVTGNASGGTVTLRLTVTSNASPSCGTATSDVTVTINAQSAGPSVTYIAPTCLETTFKVTVDNPQSGSTYTLRQLSGGVSILTAAAPTDVVNGKITFQNLTVGKGFRVTETNSVGCISSPATCGDFSGVTGAVTQRAPNTNSQVVAPPTVTAYPNPFTNQVKFVISSPLSGNGSLEVYNELGQKVKTIYRGFIKSGTQNFELSLPTKQKTALFYVFRVEDKQVTGKLLQLNN